LPASGSPRRRGAGTGGKQSAGILLYRGPAGRREVLLVHPGGPFWQKKDLGAWSIPKGEFADGEDAVAAARREFREETGHDLAGPFTPLSPVRQPGGKVVHAWAVEGDFDPHALRSNRFTLEWPPRSGQHREFPEVDRAAWFDLGEARRRINRGQAPLLDELERLARR
jgi:predicted NUDIX family NTP pyrophosphohydrolase